jgi:signal recognition particle GTPase
MALQHISPEVTVKGFKVCCIAVQWMRRIVICCGMAVKRVGMLVVSVENMKAFTVKVETATLNGKGRYNLMCFVY